MAELDEVLKEPPLAVFMSRMASAPLLWTIIQHERSTVSEGKQCRVAAGFTDDCEASGEERSANRRRKATDFHYPLGLSLLEP